MSDIRDAAGDYWASDPLMDDDGPEGFIAGALWALDRARKMIAGEDTVEWARRAKSSSINLAYAMELLDSMQEEEEDE